VFNPKLFEKLFKIAICELFPIVSYHAVRQPMSADDLFPHEIMYLSGGYGGNRLGLDPFGEIINGHYEVLYLSLRQGERS